MSINELSILSKTETHKHFSFTVDKPIKNRFSDDCYRIDSSMGDVVNSFIKSYNKIALEKINSSDFKENKKRVVVKGRDRKSTSRITLLIDENAKIQFDICCLKLGLSGSNIVENFMVSFSNAAYKTRKSLEEMEQMEKNRFKNQNTEK